MVKKSKILIIDDDKDVLGTIYDAIVGDEYQIECETNSKKALEKIKNEYYDLVITDIMMPEVSGVEIVEAVKNTSRDTLVIMVTGFASIETTIKSIQYGVYDYIQKPLGNIKHVVERALEKQNLQRKNIELNQIIEDMLAKISLLYEISTILYQVSDFREAVEMILDTITEGLKLRSVGILLDERGDSYFSVINQRALNSIIADKLKIHERHSINNQQISNSNVTILKDLIGKINITGQEIPIDKNLKTCIIVPINFHINLLGYIVVFLEENELDESENIIKLLKIFSTQIAPILHSSIKEVEAEKAFEFKMAGIIETSIIEAKSSLSPVSFSIVRLVMLDTPGEISLMNDFLSSSKSIIIKKLGKQGEIHWLTADTALLVFPATDLISIEKFCIDITESIEKLEISGNKEAVISPRYSSVSYPQVASTPTELANILWKNLFEELENNKNETMS